MSFGTMSPAWMYIQGRTLLECPRCHRVQFVGGEYDTAARCPRCGHVMASPWKVPFP